MVKFYQASIRPERTILGIVGDFDSEQMKFLVADYFGQWQGTGEPLAVTPLPAVEQANSGVFTVEQPQLTQSYIQIGHLGGSVSYPELCGPFGHERSAQRV
jgi:zinc protease